MFPNASDSVLVDVAMLDVVENLCKSVELVFKCEILLYCARLRFGVTQNKRLLTGEAFKDDAGPIWRAACASGRASKTSAVKLDLIMGSSN